MNLYGNDFLHAATTTIDGRSLCQARFSQTSPTKIKFVNMEFLRNLKSFANNAETDPKLIVEKSLAWSSSVIEEASLSNFRNAFVRIGRTMEPKNIEQKAMSLISSATTYIEANPIIFSVRLPNHIGDSCNSVQTYVNLPYLGAVSFDVFLFWSSAILSRVHMFWKSRQRKCRNRGGSTTGEGPPSPHAKSKILTGHKDKGLYKTMKECQDIKLSLRKTPDPEFMRKEKKNMLTLQKKRENARDGYLGMSPCSLRDARRFLKEVSPSQTPREYSEQI